jgi:hypothetical protein
MSKTTTQFSDAPASPPPYRKIIDQAKARAASQERPGPMQGVPRFDQLPDRNSPMPLEPVANTEKSLLSDKTVEGLKALNAQVQRTQKTLEAEEETVEIKKTEELTPEPLELSDDEKLRQAIEKRLTPIDIGQYLLSGGEVTQNIPIIPGKLEVRFRTITEYEEGWVDTYLGKQKELTNRQVLRALNECSLACYIESVNGVKWPPAVGRDGQVIPQNIDERLSRVRKFHSSIFALMVQNLGWFVERVNKSLTTEALGNG